MAEEHVEVLKKARARLVLDRRKFAESLAEGYKQGTIEEHMGKLVFVQGVIKTIDEAINDESQGREPEMFVVG